MNNSKIHKIWNSSYADYCASGSFQSDIQKKTSRAIMNCKSGRLGMNISPVSYTHLTLPTILRV